MPLTWDEIKRQANLMKHGLDFADAALVLDSEIRLDIAVNRNGEHRIQSFVYVFNRLQVLTLVHVPGTVTRIISYSTASTLERRAYYEWLADYEE